MNRPSEPAGADAAYTCSKCQKRTTPRADAETLCGFLTALTGPDPLRLRWYLALRGAVWRAQQPQPLCAACHGWVGGTFDPDVELLHTAFGINRLQLMFGPHWWRHA